ncbi:nucleotide-binding universal stress UspA family protein [Salsuginibacillus halophilus]|uniref:Nucleotide-binding universal stress UspA family protein n=1 Tax=Salsuginibacillus halophilus TaxID=517424 RepID=A0A2P8HQJ0_9BACI|nr:universal stress protein [Salsuginibacillus halophilus]PSL48491.1 nucleotide-binding universal stress UspA family protein [Salsuginibacillus halophilus]
MYKKILLAADGSDHSIRAAEHALALANITANSHIDIVNIIDSETAKTEVLKFGESHMLDDKRREKLHGVEDVLKSEVSYEVHIVHGEPGPTLVKRANENDYDVVVVGSRGLNNLQSMVLGSVSHKVAKRVNCPVMIIK